MEFNSRWSLEEIQQYIEYIRNARRGSEGRSTAEDCLLHLLEEIGELTREVRRNGSERDVAFELADCLFYLSAVATELNVDLGEALANKERYNRVRFGA